MLTLSFTGLITLIAGITLVLLMLVIIRKQPKDTTDFFDKVMLVLSVGCLSFSMVMTGFFVMAGALGGLSVASLSAEIIINNGFKLGFILFGWIKIIRNVYLIPYREKKDFYKDKVSKKG